MILRWDKEDPLDSEIEELIRGLNKLGCTTLYSCAGHRDGKRENQMACIAFKPGAVTACLNADGIITIHWYRKFEEKKEVTP